MRSGLWAVNTTIASSVSFIESFLNIKVINVIVLFGVQQESGKFRPAIDWLGILNKIFIIAGTNSLLVKEGIIISANWVADRSLPAIAAQESWLYGGCNTGD